MSEVEISHEVEHKTILFLSSVVTEDFREIVKYHPR